MPAAKRQRREAGMSALAAAAEAAIGLASDKGDEVIKGDSQKADNAAVPDQLWIRAFVLGYGTDTDSLRRHTEALRLKVDGVVAGLKRPPAGENPQAG